jgi:hypothetical protein
MMKTTVYTSSTMNAMLDEFDAAQSIRGHGQRLRAVVKSAHAVRDALLAQSPVIAVRTLPLTHLPYPTRFAFQGAAKSPVPYVQMAHRCLLIQFLEAGQLKTLLFNPTDIVAARATPFFADFIRTVGPLERFIAPRATPIEKQLADLGFDPSDIDYVAFDHFHTQDVRPILGTVDGTTQGRFSRSVLLAPRTEWEDWDCLHPMQRAWYVADGKRGVDPGRIRFLEGSTSLGEGVALLATPGHTSGNQTLLVRTAGGIWGCSENGTCADNWSPRASRIPGLGAFARKYSLEVLINSNTPELGATQYTSMMAERTIVDPVSDAPEYVQMFPSSEVSRSALAPGTAPSLLHDAVSAGAIHLPPRSTETAHARVA